MKEMVVVVAGAWEYRVRLVPAADLPEGKAGICDWAERCILIDLDLPLEAMWEVLLHEFGHAWLYHTPQPRTEEERCDLLATVRRAFERQMTESAAYARLQLMKTQGSLPAWKRQMPTFRPPAAIRELTYVPDEVQYAPLRTVEAFETPAMSRGGRAQCGRCEYLVADGSIVTSAPRWEPAYKGHVVTRTLFCPHCEHLQRWIEGADALGVPNGAVVDGPQWTSRGIDEFLALHPVAVGLVTGG